MRTDETDIDDLYRRVARPVFRHCLRILGSRACAADARQDVFIRVLRHRDRLPPPGQRMPWILSIATRICLNRLRDGAWETPVANPGPEAPPALDPATAGEDTARRQLVRQILASHDERTRAIAWKVLVEDSTVQEAGHQAGFSRKTAGRRLKAFVESARRDVLARTG